MDYLNTFIENCKAYLKSQTVEVPNSATKSQQKFEYEQELKRMFQNLESELSIRADNWGDLAFKKNEHPDISKLRSDMINAIRTILEDWKDEQKEKYGLDE
jgi:hypothetical protein